MGNWVADEVLYQARIHPSQKASTLNAEQTAALHEQMHVRESIRSGLHRSAIITCNGCQHWTFLHTCKVLSIYSDLAAYSCLCPLHLHREYCGRRWTPAQCPKSSLTRGCSIRSGALARRAPRPSWAATPSNTSLWAAG